MKRELSRHLGLTLVALLGCLAQGVRVEGHEAVTPSASADHRDAFAGVRVLRLSIEGDYGAEGEDCTAQLLEDLLRVIEAAGLRVTTDVAADAELLISVVVREPAALMAAVLPLAS